MSLVMNPNLVFHNLGWVRARREADRYVIRRINRLDFYRLSVSSHIGQHLIEDNIFKSVEVDPTGEVIA